MSLFSGIKSDGIEVEEDRLGGFTPFDTDIYETTIKVIYAGEAQSGAKNMTVIGEINGKEYRETIYYTNKAGEIFYTDKGDGKTKRGLPGYNILNAICMMTTEKGLLDQAHEDKVVKVYDFDAKAEVPKSVQVLVDTVGKPLRLAISNTTVNVKTKQDGEYVSTAKTKQENKIESVFHAETKQTLKEAIDGRDADFHDKWLERNKGQIFDKTDFNANQGGTSGRPNSGPPQSGGSNDKPRTSLFGSK